MRHILASGSEDHLPGSQARFEAKAEGRRDMFPGESFRPRSPMRGRAFEAVPSHFCLTAPVLIQSAQSLG
ncbi:MULTISPECIES: hypothetical protein [Acidaminococcus]|uniref:hypothetical protein n=1 Tax=Acidaminococcus TaxID=904 RepID=UPI0003A5F478|nr:MULTISPECIES: hypothetical protein [Acidaminococcus]